MADNDIESLWSQLPDQDGLRQLQQEAVKTGDFSKIDEVNSAFDRLQNVTTKMADQYNIKMPDFNGMDEAKATPPVGPLAPPPMPVAPPSALMGPDVGGAAPIVPPPIVTAPQPPPVVVQNIMPQAKQEKPIPEPQYDEAGGRPAPQVMIPGWMPPSPEEMKKLRTRFDELSGETQPKTPLPGLTNEVIQGVSNYAAGGSKNRTKLPPPESDSRYVMPVEVGHAADKVRTMLQRYVQPLPELQATLNKSKDIEDTLDFYDKNQSALNYYDDIVGEQSTGTLNQSIEDLRKKFEANLSPGDRAFYHLRRALMNATENANMVNDVGTPIDSGWLTTKALLGGNPNREDAKRQIDEINAAHKQAINDKAASDNNPYAEATKLFGGQKGGAKGVKDFLGSDIIANGGNKEMQQLVALAGHFPDDPDTKAAIRELQSLKAPDGTPLYKMEAPNAAFEKNLPSLANLRKAGEERGSKTSTVTGLPVGQVPVVPPAFIPGTPAAPAVTPIPAPTSEQQKPTSETTQPGEFRTTESGVKVSNVTDPQGRTLKNPFEKFLDKDGNIDIKKMMADIKAALPPDDTKKFQERVQAELGPRPKPTIWNVIGAFFSGLGRSETGMKMAFAWHDEAMKWDANRARIGQEMNTKADANIQVATTLLGQLAHAYGSQQNLQAGMYKFNTGEANKTARQNTQIAAQNLRANASNELRQKIAEEGFTSHEQIAMMNQEWKESVMRILQLPQLSETQKRTEIAKLGAVGSFFNNVGLATIMKLMK